MEKENSIKLFEEKTIRTHWDEGKEKWYFSKFEDYHLLCYNFYNLANQFMR